MTSAAPFRVVRWVLTAGLVLVALWAWSAAARKPTRPLSPNEIIQLLESGVTSARVEELAQQYGINFEPTADIEAQLRDAGATERLLSVLREMKPRVPGDEKAKPAAAEPGVLIFEATPGGALVYLDDEPVGRTSSHGRLKLSSLAPGEHEVRISLDGYLDHEEKLDLPAQQTLRLVVKLQASPPSPPAPEPAKKEIPQPSVNPPEIVPPPQTQEATFPVAHDHAKVGVPYCLGWLTVGEPVIRYHSEDNVHVFNFPLPLIKEVKKNDVYLADKGAFRIRLKDGTNYNFCLVKTSGPATSLQGTSRSKAWQPPDAVLTAIAKVIPKQ